MEALSLTAHVVHRYHERIDRAATMQAIADALERTRAVPRALYPYKGKTVCRHPPDQLLHDPETLAVFVVSEDAVATCWRATKGETTMIRRRWAALERKAG